MATEENPHAGKGAAVVLDIGGDVGALVVQMPAQMEDLEVEVIPSGTDARAGVAHDHQHEHEHGTPATDSDSHSHFHSHSHGPGGHTHTHPHGAPPHVAVVARPTPDGSTIHSLVFGELSAGTYDLYVRPDGPVRLTASVVGGQVTELRWPDWPA
ncbi:MAG: hypothetical protein M3Z00_06405 [Actinomycetota bacterium]|nr:hypothetical protein [Actinomycetota bacterium]